jgi:hypothetical protein
VLTLLLHTLSQTQLQNSTLRSKTEVFAQLYMYVISHTVIYWLCLQITLINQFTGISVLNTSVDMVMNTLHYCLIFLTNLLWYILIGFLLHLVFHSRKPLVSNCSTYNKSSRFHHNEKPLCCLYLYFQTTSRIYICHT